MATGATLVIVPVLGRPANVAPLVASIERATPEEHRILFVATIGDDDEIAAIRRTDADLLEVEPRRRGDYAFKVNEAYRQSSEPFLFTAADDLKFHRGWLGKALAVMNWPPIGVVGTNDLGNRRVLEGRHSTHTLFARAYCDELGSIDQRFQVLPEAYWHEYVDDEAIQVARFRGAFASAQDSIVEHLHPNWGKAPSDRLYEQQQVRMAHGRHVYNRRRHLWQHKHPPSS